MRIALFSETYLPQRNGVAILVDRLARHLADQGHEVFLAAPEATGGEQPTLPDSIELVRVAGVPLPRYPDLRIPPPWSRRIMHAVRDFKPDVIHALTEYSLGLIGQRAGKNLGVPTVASFHTNIPRYLPYYGFGWASGIAWRYLRWFHNRASFTFCPSETTRTVLLDRGIRDVRVWGRGVDLDRFNPEHRSDAVRSANGPVDALHLLYVGRLTPEKDLPVLFRAYQQLANSGRAIHLVLTGDGAYAPKARASAPAGVTFTGHLEGDDLARAYASADMFIFPSRTETLGNVVLEAQASGLPVVTAAEGGVLENVNHGENGLLCTPGDAASFAARISQLIDDPALRARLAANGRAWAEQRTWDAAFTPLIEGYEEVVAR